MAVQVTDPVLARRLAMMASGGSASLPTKLLKAALLSSDIDNSKTTLIQPVEMPPMPGEAQPEAQMARGGRVQVQDPVQMERMQKMADGGAAFGIYPSSGKRPEELNVSRNVNAPAQVARGWVAGTLGLPGDIEGLIRTLRNVGPMPAGVSTTPTLPTSEFYREYLPGGDQSPAGKFFGGAGAMTGGMGAANVARAVQAGAKQAAPIVGSALEQVMQRQGMAIPITTWQGSPHRFDPEKLVRLPSGEEAYVGGRFNPIKEVPAGATVLKDFPFGRIRSEAINTGEGSQAYGHGSYLAESPGVAKSYKDKLSDTLMAPEDAPLMERRLAQVALNYGGGETSGAINWLNKYRNAEGILDEPLVAKVEKKLKSGEFAPGGNLYKVDLPDPIVEKMLDWDKPLSQQPEVVRKAIPEDVLQRLEEDQSSAWKWAYPDSGQGLYASLRATHGSDQAASDYLRSLGIPGIKYFDQSSRAAGEGTRNFVIFPGEEKNLTILERNAEKVGALPVPEQKMRQGFYRGYAGEYATPQAAEDAGMVFVSPQRAVGERYAQKRAAQTGLDPHLEMVLADPFAGYSYQHAVAGTGKNPPLVTRARQLAPEDVKDVTQLYSEGGRVRVEDPVIAEYLSRLGIQ